MDVFAMRANTPLGGLLACYMHYNYSFILKLASMAYDNVIFSKTN